MAALTIGVFTFGRLDGKKEPAAARGFMDLSGADFDGGGLVGLNGEWEFYWSQLLTPEDFKGVTGTKPHLTGYIKVPSIWVKAVEGMRLPNRGYGTYRLRVKLKPTDAILGLKTANIRLASKIYINGTSVMNSGIPAVDPRHHIPGNTPKTAFFRVEGNEMEVIVQVANHVYKSGGIIQSIYFGGQQAILDKSYHSAAMDTVVVSALILIALIHLIMYITSIGKMHKEPMQLTIGLICLTLAVGIAGIGEKIVFQTFTQLPTELGYKITDFCMYISYALEAIFLIQIGKNIVPSLFAKGAVAFFGAYSLVIVFTPLSFYSSIQEAYNALKMLFFVSTFILLVVAFAKRNYGNIGRNGMLVLITAFYFTLLYMTDFTLYNISFKTDYTLSAVCVFLFVMMFSLLIAIKFSEAASDIHSMTVQLMTLDKLKDEFLANTSHELQTPINGILNISQSMLEGGSGSVNEMQRHNLAIVVSTAKRLSALINDILDMAKLKRNEIKLNIAPVDIKGNVAVVIDVLRYMSSDRDIELKNQLPEGFVSVYADENRLRQVLYNIINNSVKYTESGTITVAGEIKGNKAKVTIEDTGIGIPEDKHELIFQSFEQVDSSITRTHGGTGLGLSISRKLIELMGGTLVLEWSEPGKGSRFAFELPACGEHVRFDRLLARQEQEAAMPLQRRETRPEVIKGGKYRILVVDDELSNLYVMINMLSNEDYDILTAEDGQTALDCIKKQGRIDLVIMDVMMPRMSGLEACRIIREEHSLLELPVLLLTAHSEPELASIGFEAGANDFVVKPFDAALTRARVRTLLKLKESMEEAVENEMAFLQSQIKPHFIYNALNSISSLCITDGERASELIDQLSIYMRKCFRGIGKNSLITLESELELVKVYLSIEKARFGDRLSVEYAIDENAACMLPPLVLQPLVENAIRHGLMKRRAGGQVRIAVEMKPEKVFFSIEDNGVGIAPELLKELLQDYRESSGVGLLNIHRRLINMFQQGLSVESAEGMGTKVSFCIPLNDSIGAKNSGDSL